VSKVSEAYERGVADGEARTNHSSWRDLFQLMEKQRDDARHERDDARQVVRDHQCVPPANPYLPGSARHAAFGHPHEGVGAFCLTCGQVRSNHVLFRTEVRGFCDLHNQPHRFQDGIDGRSACVNWRTEEDAHHPPTKNTLGKILGICDLRQHNHPGDGHLLPHPYYSSCINWRW
jgi:hypothetical protein